MNKFMIYDKTIHKQVLVMCDEIIEKEFDNTEEFNKFLKMHPSCFYCNKQIERRNGKITATFNRYKHKAINNNGEVRYNLSFNQNAMDEYKLREYYELKKQEDELKYKLNKIKELSTYFE